jgi:hypothetical protein
METRTALPSDVSPSDARPARHYVVRVRTELGQTFRSIPFAD